jgi:hypothetical protein
LQILDLPRNTTKRGVGHAALPFALQI